MSQTRSSLRTLGVAARAVLVLTLVLGFGYTALITLIAQTTMPAHANGSLIEDASGRVVGSALIGQSFTDTEGRPLARYFQSRPSAAGDGYDGASSGASNLGPESPELIEQIRLRRAEVAAFNGVRESDVPADAVTASSSGLDPHISPAYARIQVARVARERGLDERRVLEAVARHTEQPALGYLGDEVVNVLELNLELDSLEG